MECCIIALRPPLIETLLPTLLNEIATMSQQVMLIIVAFRVAENLAKAAAPARKRRA